MIEATDVVLIGAAALGSGGIGFWLGARWRAARSPLERSLKATAEDAAAGGEAPEEEPLTDEEAAEARALVTRREAGASLAEILEVQQAHVEPEYVPTVVRGPAELAEQIEQVVVEADTAEVEAALDRAAELARSFAEPPEWEQIDTILQRDPEPTPEAPPVPEVPAEAEPDEPDEPEGTIPADVPEVPEVGEPDEPDEPEAEAPRRLPTRQATPEELRAYQRRSAPTEDAEAAVDAERLEAAREIVARMVAERDDPPAPDPAIDPTALPWKKWNDPEQ